MIMYDINNINILMFIYSSMESKLANSTAIVFGVSKLL